MAECLGRSPEATVSNDGSIASADGAAIIRYDRALSRENTLSLASVIMEYTNTMDPPLAYDIAKRNCDIFAASCRLGSQNWGASEDGGVIKNTCANTRRASRIAAMGSMAL
eukprot:gene27290-4593_t